MLFGIWGYVFSFNRTGLYLFVSIGGFAFNHILAMLYIWSVYMMRVFPCMQPRIMIREFIPYFVFVCFHRWVCFCLNLWCFSDTFPYFIVEIKLSFAGETLQQSFTRSVSLASYLFRVVQNRPNDPKFTRPYKRTQFDPTSKIIYNYVKYNMYTKHYFKPIRNT